MNQEPNFELKEESFNYMALLMRMLNNWYLYLISFILALTAAYFYTKYTVSVFEVSTTLLIQNESPSFSTERVLEDMSLFSTKRNILNEKIILKSYDVINETLRQLDFLVSYYTDDGYRLTELYHSRPFNVIPDSASLQLADTQIELEMLTDEKFRITCSIDEIRLYSFEQDKLTILDKRFDFKGEFGFGEQVSSDYFNFKIERNNPAGIKPAKKGDRFKFMINDLNKLTLGFSQNLKVDLLEKNTDVLMISMQGSNVSKLTDFLNKLTTVYIDKKLEKKNLNANNTIQFIDAQLFIISDSLMDAENRLQSFKSASKLMDVGFQAQNLFEQLTQLEREKAILLSQRKYFEHTLNSLQRGSSLEDIMIPSTMGISDANLNKLIGEIIDLSSKRMALASNATEKSQAIVNIDLKIENIKKLIVYNLNSLVENTDISLKGLNNQISGLESEARKLPVVQQKLFGYERQFILNNEIFNFLMQKRAEAQIAKASNTPDSEVIDEARTDVYKKVSAKLFQILIVVVILAFLIPTIWIVIRSMLMDTILMRQDLEEITDTPVVGNIILAKTDSMKIFIDEPNSPVAESFRSFYANLQYFTKGKSKQVILISSSMPSEGKTFNSINLAMVYASFGKKTCLVSFDLRLAKVHHAFDLKGDTGISTYLINYSGLSDIIYDSGVSNLDVIPAGPPPPNPLELIASAKTTELMNHLQTVYDCIIIDSPPLGVVADAMFLAKYSDVNVIIARQNFTRKKVLAHVIRELDANQIQNRAILFNGIKQSRLGGYGYSYGYGYGYGYYKQAEKKWWKQVADFGKKMKKT